jgi:hypothetical protein
MPKLDLGPDLPPPPPDPDEEPQVCNMPVMLGADVLVMTPIGDTMMQAAVFAADGGGKCPIGYRVLLASDLEALPVELEHATVPEDFGTALTIQFGFWPGSPEPGELDATVTIWIDGMLGQVTGPVAITTVTHFDDPMAIVEGTIMIEEGEWLVQGSFSAPYCNLARGPGCGA